MSYPWCVAFTSTIPAHGALVPAYIKPKAENQNPSKSIESLLLLSWLIQFSKSEITDRPQKRVGKTAKNAWFKTLLFSKAAEPTPPDDRQADGVGILSRVNRVIEAGIEYGTPPS